MTPVVLACFLAVAVPGCLSGSYHVSQDELMRLARTDPAQRWTSVRATQGIGTGSDPPGNVVDTRTSVVPLVPMVYFSGGQRYNPAPAYSPPAAGGSGGGFPGTSTGGTSGHGGSGGHGGGGGGSGGGGGGGGSFDPAVVVVAVVAAGVIVFVLAGTEGARYDGWITVNPNEWVYLDQGEHTLAVPLPALTEDMARAADGATLYEGQAPRYGMLGRAALNREGFSLQAGALVGGVPAVGGGVGSVGVGGRMFLGGFPVHQVGVGLSGDFLYGDVLFAMVGGEVQAMPFRILGQTLGAYAGAGFASWNPGGTGAPGSTDGTSGGWYVRAGLQAEFPITTRLAFQVRAGATRFDLGSALGASVTTEASAGLAVY